MNLKRKAQALISYLQSLPDFELAESATYDHMGAIIVDTMLQAGVHWNAVKPRIDKVREYEEAKTTSGFLSLLSQHRSVSCFLDWKGKKPKWVLGLAKFLKEEKVETVSDLRKWIQFPKNQEKLLGLAGFGKKTRDYLIKLSGLPSIAIDRQLYKALDCARIHYRNYYDDAQQIMESAADIWGINKSVLDTSIWRYFKKFRGNECP